MISDAHLLDGLIEDVADARRHVDLTQRAAAIARKSRDGAIDSLERAERRLHAHLKRRVDEAMADAPEAPGEAA